MTQKFLDICKPHTCRHCAGPAALVFRLLKAENPLQSQANEIDEAFEQGQIRLRKELADYVCPCVHPSDDRFAQLGNCVSYIEDGPLFRISKQDLNDTLASSCVLFNNRQKAHINRRERNYDDEDPFFMRCRRSNDFVVLSIIGPKRGELLWSAHYNLVVADAFATTPVLSPEIRFPSINRSDEWTRQHIFDLAKSWLLECRSNHQLCNKQKADWMPTRILRLSPTRDSVILCQSSELKQMYDYAALSYCWGQNDQALMLSRANWERFRRGVDPKELGRTLQDAVTTTLGLGLNYLWVDALCILQNDEEDKSREIDQMSSVYSNATITILASIADAASDGFLHDIEPFSKAYLSSMIRVDSKVPFGPLSTAMLVRPHLSTPSRLSTRAWAYQESLLSARYVDFKADEVEWRCNESTASDRSHGFEPRKRGRRAVSIIDLEQSVTGSHFPYKFKTQWNEVMSNISGRFLRDRADLLNSIAGIADKFAQASTTFARNSDEWYAAGHWRSSMPSSLLWRVDHFRRATMPVDDINPSRDLGPTWSWPAAGVGTLYPKFSWANLHVDDLKVDVVPYVQGSKYGRVKNGTIKLKGYLLQIEQSPDSRHIVAVHDGGEVPCSTILSKIVFDFDRDGEDTVVASFHLLLIGSVSPKDGNAGYEAGLILRQNTESTPATFARIGIFDTSRYEALAPGPIAKEKEIELSTRRLAAFQARRKESLTIV